MKNKKIQVENLKIYVIHLLLQIGIHFIIIEGLLIHDSYFLAGLSRFMHRQNKFHQVSQSSRHFCGEKYRTRILLIGTQHRGDANMVRRTGDRSWDVSRLVKMKRMKQAVLIEKCRLKKKRQISNKANIIRFFCATNSKMNDIISLLPAL